MSAPTGTRGGPASSIVGPDRIELRGVRAMGCHGVLPAEKREPQPFVVDVDLDVDLLEAGAGDDLGRTVSYADVAADVVAVVEGGSVDLVETLAAAIAKRCLAYDRVEAVTVVVHKPKAPVGVPFTDVGVRIRRERRRPVVVALGANLGDAAATLAAAVADLSRVPGFEIRGVSPLVETDPVGGPEQPVYLNAVLLGESRLHPETLLRHLHRVEAAHGRERRTRWGPRTLDLDLVQVGDPVEATDVRSEGEVTLPHPRAHERAFVLVPWLAVAPHARLRIGDEVVPVADLVAGVDRGGVREGPTWAPTW